MYDSLEKLQELIINCNKCRLCTNRTNVVFGEGNKQADVMFIGEGPRSVDEDKKGEIFIGKAGQLMSRVFEGLEINREKIYITNIVKCKIPENGVLQQDEVNACLNYLRNQVILIKPKIIVLLGNTALKNILGKDYGLASVRGNWMEQKGILYMPTWNPLALLIDENKKIEFWQDLKKVKEKARDLQLIL